MNTFITLKEIKSQSQHIMPTDKVDIDYTWSFVY